MLDKQPPPQAKNKIKTNAFIKISEKAISLILSGKSPKRTPPNPPPALIFGGDSISGSVKSALLRTRQTWRIF